MILLNMYTLQDAVELQLYLFLSNGKKVLYLSQKKNNLGVKSPVSP